MASLFTPVFLRFLLVLHFCICLSNLYLTRKFLFIFPNHYKTIFITISLLIIHNAVDDRWPLVNTLSLQEVQLTDSLTVTAFTEQSAGTPHHTNAIIISLKIKTKAVNIKDAFQHKATPFVYVWTQNTFNLICSF